MPAPPFLEPAIADPLVGSQRQQLSECPYAPDPVGAVDPRRPPLEHVQSDSSLASSTSIESTSTAATSVCSPTAARASSSPRLISPSVPLQMSPDAVATVASDAAALAAAKATTNTNPTTKGIATEAAPLGSSASSPPLHSFPTFLLSLLTAIESDPASIRAHLDNLAGCRAAPATFAALPEGKPAETEAIVQSLARIADRLSEKEEDEEEEDEGAEPASKEPVENHTVHEAQTPSAAFARTNNGIRTPLEQPTPATQSPARVRHRSRPTTADASARRPLVPGNTLEEVRRNYEEQIQALKVLHAEELYRSQVSHDNEVRSVWPRFRFPPGFERGLTRSPWKQIHSSRHFGHRSWRVSCPIPPRTEGSWDSRTHECAVPVPQLDKDDRCRSGWRDGRAEGGDQRHGLQAPIVLERGHPRVTRRRDPRSTRRAGSRDWRRRNLEDSCVTLSLSPLSLQCC